MADHIDSRLSSLLSPGRPASNPAAKTAAKALAMNAFDDGRKKVAGRQGSKAGLRFMDVFNLLGSSMMKYRYLLASVAFVVVAAPLAFSIVGTQSFSLGPSGAMTNNGGASFGDSPVATSVGSVAKADQGSAQPSAGSPALVPSHDYARPAPSAHEQMAAYQLAITEALRLSTGQMSGDVRREVTGRENATHDPRLMALAVKDVTQPPQFVGGRFTSSEINGMKNVAADPVSTFAIDVDTASYSYARRSILNGRLPEPDSVRVEELVNYFPYDWQAGSSADEPFNPSVTIAPTPWNPDTKLLHIGIQGYDLPAAEQKQSNLVFLVDVSGSMQSADKLPLLKTSLRMLVERLKPTDTVSIVTYAGSSGVALRPTAASDKAAIFAALDGLEAGGGTNGAQGLKTAYDLAQESFVKDGVNRIFLATDGDFNIGASSDDDLERLVESRRKSGVFLSVLGFGADNYNDGMMQTLAQNGNGVAAYIDTLEEAEKTLVEEASASIFPIAKDVKIQVEFNPTTVARYRLIGYETRALATEDFNNDKVDAGEVGSGHRVTAIYEIVPKDSPAATVDDRRYATPEPASKDAEADKKGELAFLKIRYKKPSEETSRLITRPILADQQLKSIDEASADVKFSVGVAAFAQKLKHESWVDGYDWKAVVGMMKDGAGEDPYGLRRNAIRLAQIAGSLAGRDEVVDPLR
jgi:Ca-activated chloride channel family protein